MPSAHARCTLMIAVEGLTKLYGDFPAVSDLTFTVQPGEVMGLVGFWTRKVLSSMLKSNSWCVL